MPPIDAPDLRLPYDVAALDDAPLRTERLVLRPLADSDSWDVWQYQRLPEVLRYIPWPERTREDAFAHTRKRAGLRRLEREDDAVILAMELVGEPTTTPGTATGAGDRVIGDIMLRL